MMIHNSIIPNYQILLLCALCFCMSCREDTETDASPEVHVPNDSVDPIIEDYEIPERKVGFIDNKGDVVIQARFDEARIFNNGLAAVNLKGLWGYIDKKGKEVIPPQYLGSWTFSNKLGRVQSASNRMFGFINAQGDTVIDLKYANARDFVGNLAPVGGESYWGVIDNRGTEVILPQYDNVKILSGDYVAVQENELWGVVQIGHGIMISPKFQKIYTLRSNVLRVKTKNGRFQYINLEDEHIFEKDFYQASDPQEGIYAVCDSPDHCYLMDREGEKLSSPFQNVRPGNEGLFIAKRNNQWGVIGVDGSVIIPIRYDLIYNFQEGYAPYLKNSLWGYVSSEGQVKIPPAFGLAWPFQNGKARVLTRQGIAIINTDFEVIIPASKGELRDFNEGLAPFKAN